MEAKTGEEIRNFTKAKVLYWLVALDSLEEAPYHYRRATALDMAEICEVNLGSLYVLLPRWVTFGYITEEYWPGELMSDNHGHRLYKIAPGGRAYVERMPRWYPRAAEANEAVTWEKGEGCNPPVIQIRCISWLVEPSQYYTVLEYPFQKHNDAHPRIAWRDRDGKKSYFEVDNRMIIADNAEIVFYMAWSLFGVEPSPDCKEMALAYQKHYLEKAVSMIGKWIPEVTLRRLDGGETVVPGHYHP